jgi:hypothetical protein
MKHKTSIATLFLLGTLSVGAFAADPAPPPTGGASTQAAPPAKDPPAPLFQQLDVNHDLYITKEEAKRSADVTARFDKLDVNHDGKISADEFKSGMQAKL